MNKIFKKDDYILSFWVRGVSVFVTDIHLEAYKALQPLFIIDDGMFKQYFTKIAYEQALDRGIDFYSDEDAFDNYKIALSSHCEKFKEFFESEIKNQKTLSREKGVKFFEYTIKLCGDYTQMNFESTDKVFLHQDDDPVVKGNLSKVAKFKDTVRTFMNIVLFDSNSYCNQLFAILGRQFDLSPSTFNNLTQQEILALFDGKKPDELSVGKRQEAFVESCESEDAYEGEDAKNIIQEFREELLASNVLRGRVANRGRAIGKVKIISVDYSDLHRLNAEIDRMKKGDILVAETTAPELIVACKKAAAIVTDIGGMMSHAAIISRELGIPCIVGTQFAAKVLHDGDLVEVDADKGVVIITKRRYKWIILRKSKKSSGITLIKEKEAHFLIGFRLIVWLQKKFL